VGRLFPEYCSHAASANFRRLSAAAAASWLLFMLTLATRLCTSVRAVAMEVAGEGGGPGGGGGGGDHLLMADSGPAAGAGAEGQGQGQGQPSSQHALASIQRPAEQTV
jgi:hypothetical protein